MSALLRLQQEYALALAELVVWIYDQGWAVTFGEGYVRDTDSRDGDHDGPHRADGGHYKRLATDINLFVDGEWVRESTHPAWAQIHQHWLSLHPAAGLIAHDANHFGFRHQGVL